MGKMRGSKQRQKPGDSKKWETPNMSFGNIMKDIELFSCSHMTWKERKEIENKKVVALGGKPPRNQRLPLSVARVQMKKQKEREQRLIEQNMVLGQFGATSASKHKKTTKRRRPEDMVLKASEGYFRNGVLKVKHLLNSGPSRDDKRGGGETDTMMSKKKGNGKKGNGKKGNGKKGKGKKKGGHKKGH